MPLDPGHFVLGAVTAGLLARGFLYNGTDRCLGDFDGDYVSLNTASEDYQIRGKVLQIDDHDNILLDVNGSYVAANQAIYSPNEVYSVTRFEQDLGDKKLAKRDNELSKLVQHGTGRGWLHKFWDRTKAPLANSVNAVSRVTTAGASMYMGGSVTTEGAQAVFDNIGGSWDDNLEHLVGYGVSVKDPSGREYRGILTDYSDGYLQLSDVKTERFGKTENADVVIPLPQKALDFTVPADFNTYLMESLRRTKNEADGGDGLKVWKTVGKKVFRTSFGGALDPYKGAVEDVYEGVSDLMTRLNVHELGTLSNNTIEGKELLVAGNAAYKMLEDIDEVTDTMGRVFAQDATVFDELVERNADYSRVFEVLRVENTGALERMHGYAQEHDKAVREELDVKREGYVSALTHALEIWTGRDWDDAIEDITDPAEAGELEHVAEGIEDLVLRTGERYDGQVPENWTALGDRVGHIKATARLWREELERDQEKR